LLLTKIFVTLKGPPITGVEELFFLHAAKKNKKVSETMHFIIVDTFFIQAGLSIQFLKDPGIKML
jgi:hypothetical protein